jgi:hypothetical protein
MKKMGWWKQEADGSDYDIYKDGLKIYTILIQNACWRGCCSHGKSSGRIFYSGKRIKKLHL